MSSAEMWLCKECGETITEPDTPTAHDLRVHRNDPVNPAHYRGDTVMRIIEDFDLGFCLGNVVKYVFRHGAKAGIEDLKKARWYLDRQISNMEAK